MGRVAEAFALCHCERRSLIIIISGYKKLTAESRIKNY